MENTVKRVTKRDYFEGLRVVVEGSTAENKDELIAFIEKELEQLAKRNSSRGGKPTKRQVENEGHLETIYNVLVDLGTASSIEDIQAADDTLAEFTSQKMVSLLKKLVDVGRVVKTCEKRKTYYLAVK